MNVAPRPAISSIALCAGVGMLDEGAAAGFDHLGFDYRTVAYVERDAYAAAALVARMESAALAQALVWDDLKTFPCRAFRGRVDCISAGFPCQDLSVAGSRAGLGGKRSGLFFDCLDIAEACGAWLLWLENVTGIASAGASVVDKAFGELTERAAARVVGELADRGWSAEWLHLRASAVGASHGRERWFCLAWRVADTECHARGAERQHESRPRAASRTGDGSVFGDGRGGYGEPCSKGPCDFPLCRPRSRCQRSVADANGAIGSGPGRFSQAGRIKSGVEGRAVANGDRSRRRSAPQSDEAGRKSLGQEESAGCGERFGPAIGRSEQRSGDVAHTRLQHIELQQRHDGAESQGVGVAVAHSSSARLPQRRIADDRLGAVRHEGQAALADRRAMAPGGHDLFAPGPGDIGGWNRVVSDGEFDFRAPAVKPGVCRVVDGLAYRVDQHRADRLRCGGNGVVALQAAAALVVLVRRAGIFGEI